MSGKTGDSFVAGFLTGLVHDWDSHRCRFANAVGAHSDTAVGAPSGIKSIDGIMAYIAASHRAVGD